MKEMSFSPEGKLYTLESGGTRVFEVNLQTGDLSLAGDVSPIIIRGLEFSSGGVLYGSFANLYTLDTADLSTGTLVGDTGGIYVSTLTFDNDEALIGMDVYPSTHLYSLDTDTGAAAIVVPVSSPGLVSLVAEQAVPWSPGSRALATGSADETGSTRDIETLLELEQEMRDGELSAH